MKTYHYPKRVDLDIPVVSDPLGPMPLPFSEIFDLGSDPVDTSTLPPSDHGRTLGTLWMYFVAGVDVSPNPDVTSYSEAKVNATSTFKIWNILVTDLEGNPIPNVAIVGDSGIEYPVNVVPEPSGAVPGAAALLVFVAAVRRRRSAHRRPGSAWTLCSLPTNVPSGAVAVRALRRCG